MLNTKKDYLSMYRIIFWEYTVSRGLGFMTRVKIKELLK